MKEIDMNALLTQLRTNQMFTNNLPQGLEQAQQGQGVGEDFSALLKQSIDKVNALQKQSGSLTKAFELGDANVSLAEVMIAKQKAGIAFQSVLQVRNKLVEAYKEVMSMHV